MPDKTTHVIEGDPRNDGIAPPARTRVKRPRRVNLAPARHAA
jgi:hypothetical protein